MKKLLLTAACLLACAFPALAEEADVGGFKVDLAPNGVVRAGDWVGAYDPAKGLFHLFALAPNQTIWTLKSAKQGSVVSEGARSVVSAMRVNCEEKKYFLLTSIYYDDYFGKGTQLQTVTPADDWQLPKAGTIEHLAIRVWCSRRQSAPAP